MTFMSGEETLDKLFADLNLPLPLDILKPGPNTLNRPLGLPLGIDGALFELNCVALGTRTYRYLLRNQKDMEKLEKSCTIEEQPL